MVVQKWEGNCSKLLPPLCPKCVAYKCNTPTLPWKSDFDSPPTWSLRKCSVLLQLQVILNHPISHILLRRTHANYCESSYHDGWKQQLRDWLRQHAIFAFLYVRERRLYSNTLYSSIYYYTKDMSFNRTLILVTSQIASQ